MVWFWSSKQKKPHCWWQRCVLLPCLCQVTSLLGRVRVFGWDGIGKADKRLAWSESPFFWSLGREWPGTEIRAGDGCGLLLSCATIAFANLFDCAQWSIWLWPQHYLQPISLTPAFLPPPRCLLTHAPPWGAVVLRSTRMGCATPSSSSELPECRNSYTEAHCELWRVIYPPNGVLGFHVKRGVYAFPTCSSYVLWWLSDSARLRSRRSYQKSMQTRAYVVQLERGPPHRKMPNHSKVE